METRKLHSIDAVVEEFNTVNRSRESFFSPLQQELALTTQPHLIGGDRESASFLRWLQDGEAGEDIGTACVCSVTLRKHYSTLEVHFWCQLFCSGSFLCSTLGNRGMWWGLVIIITTPFCARACTEFCDIAWQWFWQGLPHGAVFKMKCGKASDVLNTVPDTKEVLDKS